jgi:hypothetical protein
MFLPVSDDEVDDLVAATAPARKDKGGNRKHAVKTEPVELPRATQPRSEPVEPPTTPASIPAEPAPPTEPDR